MICILNGQLVVVTLELVNLSPVGSFCSSVPPGGFFTFASGRYDKLEPTPLP